MKGKLSKLFKIRLNRFLGYDEEECYLQIFRQHRSDILPKTLNSIFRNVYETNLFVFTEKERKYICVVLTVRLTY